MKVKDIMIIGIVLLAYWLLIHFIMGGMENKTIIIFFIVIPGLISSFNFLMRKNVNFQWYYTSKYNLLTSKYKASTISDLPKELMFQKMIEVIDSSHLKLIHTEEESLKIFAIKGLTWQSWGENIYIEFYEENGQTIMSFTSTAVMGIVSMGRNEENYGGLLANYEESLII